MQTESINTKVRQLLDNLPVSTTWEDVMGWSAPGPSMQACLGMPHG
jgi:hypothetical protein